MSAEKITLLFIVGSPKTYDQVVRRDLNKREKVFVLGDSSRFWEEYHSPSYYCTCGDRISDCPFWKDVYSKIMEFQQGVVKFDPSFKDLRRVVDNYAFLFRAISEVSGCRLLVDLTMDPVLAARFLKTSEFDVHVVHLEGPLVRVVKNWIHLLPLPVKPISFVPLEMKPFFSIIRQWVYRKFKAGRLRHFSKYNFIKETGEGLNLADRILKTPGLEKRNTPGNDSPQFLRHGIYKSEYSLSRVGIVNAPQAEISRWKQYVSVGVDKLANFIIRS